MRHIRRVETLRGRVFATLILAILVAAVPMFLLPRYAVGDTKQTAEANTLALAEAAAANADRIVVEAFLEVESASGQWEPSVGGDPLDFDSSRSLFSPATGFTVGLLLVDDQGEVLAAEPEAIRPDTQDAAQAFASAGRSTSREVSTPFVLTSSGALVSALSQPMYGEGGRRLWTAVGLLDLTKPLIAVSIESAAALGPTGHADLVDERGLVLASTDPGNVMTTGDHPAFYRRMAETRRATVGEVTHEHNPGDADQSARHIMAYAPLRNAPWGIALGASADDTFRAVNALRERLLILIGVSVFTLLAGAVLAAKLVPNSSHRT